MGKKKRQKNPPPLEISPEEVKELLKRIEEKKLEDGDFETIKAFIESFVYIRELSERQKLSNKKLKTLLWGKTEKSKNILPESESDKDKTESEGEDSGSGIEDAKKEKVKTKKKGHGRNGASSYLGAKVIEVSHKELKAGQLCPECEKGKLYKWYKDGIKIRIKGGPPLKALVYKLEKLRCALCGQLYTAELPEEAGQDKYDAKASSIIALLKYGSNMAFSLSSSG